jgi:dTMP kinase
LLYLAREAQLVDEITRAATAEADVVIADRFVYTAEVLACAGRGLPAGEVRPVVELAARGLVPDLVILIDADPHVARARRRIAKIVSPRLPTRPSRKGQAGVGLLHRCVTVIATWRRAIATAVRHRQLGARLRRRRRGGLVRGATPP